MKRMAGRHTQTYTLYVAGLPMGQLIPPVKDALLHVFSSDAQLRDLLVLQEYLRVHPQLNAQQHDQNCAQENTRDAEQAPLALNICAADSSAMAAPKRSNTGSGARTEANAETDLLQTGFEHLANALRQAGLVPGWRNEKFSVRKPDGSVWFALERACFRPLGFISHAVHAHAWCENGDTWLGRRAAHKATDPGLLDNLAAGGLSHGEEPFDCMVRELWEEAGVPPDIARRIERLPEQILSERMEAEGMHREWLHCYTLELPDSFTPANRDGEVSGFTRCTISELQALTASDAMTRDAALCAELALRCRRRL